VSTADKASFGSIDGFNETMNFGADLMTFFSTITLITYSSFVPEVVILKNSSLVEFEVAPEIFKMALLDEPTFVGLLTN